MKMGVVVVIGLMMMGNGSCGWGGCMGVMIN